MIFKNKWKNKCPTISKKSRERKLERFALSDISSYYKTTITKTKFHWQVIDKYVDFRGMEWGGRWEEGSGWGTHVYLWRIHFDIWQN